MKKRWVDDSNICNLCGGEGSQKSPKEAGTQIACSGCGGTGYGPKEPPNDKARSVATAD